MWPWRPASRGVDDSSPGRRGARLQYRVSTWVGEQRAQRRVDYALERAGGDAAPEDGAVQCVAQQRLTKMALRIEARSPSAKRFSKIVESTATQVGDETLCVGIIKVRVVYP